MRAFLGMALPDEARRLLERLQRELAASGADVKWVDPHNLHVTLKFLGEISETQQEAVSRMVMTIAAATPSFLASLKEVGAFPTLESPRVIWVGMAEGADALTRMAEAIEREGTRLSLRAEERPFAAHLTLGRTRSARGLTRLVERLRAVSWDPPAPWPVTAVSFYRSDLSSAGPAYSVLAEYPLAK